MVTASGFSGAYAEADSALTTLDASANRVYEATQLLKAVEAGFRHHQSILL